MKAFNIPLAVSALALVVSSLSFWNGFAANRGSSAVDFVKDQRALQKDVATFITSTERRQEQLIKCLAADPNSKSLQYFVESTTNMWKNAVDLAQSIEKLSPSSDLDDRLSLLRLEIDFHAWPRPAGEYTIGESVCPTN